MPEHYSLEPANYEDYREFLRVRFETLKKVKPGLSLSALAKRAGCSKALLQFVFQKKRHLALDRLPQLSKPFRLSTDEEYYLYLMVCYNSSRNNQVRRHFNEILNRIRHEFVKTDAQSVVKSDSNDKAIYTDYLKMIIQAVVRLEMFQEDETWIHEQLMLDNINLQGIRTLLEEMERSGNLHRDQSGRLRAEEDVLWRPDVYDPNGFDVYSAGAQAIATLMRTPKLYRPSVYSSMCHSMDEENLLKAEKFMIEVHHQLDSFARQSKRPSAVVFVGNYFLTVARTKQECLSSDRVWLNGARQLIAVKNAGLYLECDQERKPT